MKQIAIDKALEKLEKALLSLTRMEVADNFKDMKSCWIDLIISLNSIYSILSNNRDRQGPYHEWFSKEKEFRDEDELLNYLHHARNADEHGFEPILENEPAHLRVTEGSPGQGLFALALYRRADGLTALYETTDAKPPSITAVPEGAKLITVDGKRGRRVHPPSTHKGSALWESSPVIVARAGYDYHQKLIEKAAFFVK